MPSLALAAEVQMGLLERGVRGLGIEAQSKIRSSLESLCYALETFQGPSGGHKACIHDCRAYLGSSRSGSWFTMSSAECMM